MGVGVNAVMSELDVPRSPRFNLPLLFFLTLNAAILLACVRSIPRYGSPIGIEMVAILCCLASFSGAKRLRPLSTRRWTVVEIVVVAVNCAILHGLAMPAVTSGPH